MSSAHGDDPKHGNGFVEILEDYELRRHLHKYQYVKPKDSISNEKCESRGRTLLNLFPRIKSFIDTTKFGSDVNHDTSMEMQDELFTYKANTTGIVELQTIEHALVTTLRSAISGKLINVSVVERTMDLLITMVDKACAPFSIPNFDFQMSYLEIDVLSQNNPLAFFQCLGLIRYGNMTVDRFLNTTCKYCDSSCVRSNPVIMDPLSFTIQMAINWECLRTSRCNDHVNIDFIKMKHVESYAAEATNQDKIVKGMDIEKLIKCDEDFSTASNEIEIQSTSTSAIDENVSLTFADPYTLPEAIVKKYIVDTSSLKSIRCTISNMNTTPSKDTSSGSVFKWVEYFAKIKSLGLCLHKKYTHFEKPPSKVVLSVFDFCPDKIVTILEQTPAFKIAILFCLSNLNWEESIKAKCPSCNKHIVLKPETTPVRFSQKPKIFVESMLRRMCTNCFISHCERHGNVPHVDLKLTLDLTKVAFTKYHDFIQPDLWDVFDSGFAGRIFLKGREKILEAYFKDKHKATLFFTDPFLNMLALEYMLMDLGSYESVRLLKCRFCGNPVYATFGGLFIKLEKYANPFINSLCYTHTAENLSTLKDLKEPDKISTWIIEKQIALYVQNSNVS